MNIVIIGIGNVGGIFVIKWVVKGYIINFGVWDL